MNDPAPKVAAPVAQQLAQQIEQLCEEFALRLQSGEAPILEEYLGQIPGQGRNALFRELLYIELESGSPSRSDYVSRFPGDVSLIDAVWQEATQAYAAGQRSSQEPGPECGKPSAASADISGRAVGRYQIKEVIGRGGCAKVYKGWDEELHRDVAIKVPFDPTIDEARTVAQLDHPVIVPVYDIHRDADGTCYVVSKLIAGGDLKQRLQKQRYTFRELAELIATIADGLHFAHREGVFHRDIKPSNILLDDDGQPLIADFGLAFHDKDFGSGAQYAGSPAYMSPEQARGESHRVDGRSDIFSLGTVLYEALTSHRPFRSTTRSAIIDEICNHDERPPRQIDDRIPVELERICQKAMAKRASERYATAADMASELRQFVAQDRQPSTGASAPQPAAEVPVVPKGLRSYDAGDADFFLSLLPGPRDRHGVPESIRFWKQRIEERASDDAFSVGLIYGPSGCGKSSFVRAGLLPCLDDSVIPIYVEATAADTVSALKIALCRRFMELAADDDLPSMLAAVRTGDILPGGKKLLIVIDQLEQWFHNTTAEENSLMVRSLRQCDGESLQSLLLVRADFCMGAARLMNELEIALDESRNSRAVDLFDERHAREVLARFGSAYGQLPRDLRTLAKEQSSFLDQVVTSLAENGRVIPVQLALCADMLSAKRWVPSTWVSGLHGLGIMFFEETFAAKTAPPGHQRHQRAAAKVLQTMLPITGGELKGPIKARSELLEASGYSREPGDFDALLKILDQELRLVTPTDSIGQHIDDGGESHESSADRYFQLTHDYLVPALRDWIQLKNKQSVRGRAHLRLEERTALWNLKQDSRNLPRWWEYLNIRLFVPKSIWSDRQVKMMRIAGKHHGLRGVLLATVTVIVLMATVYTRRLYVERQNTVHASHLIDRILDADIGQVARITTEMEPFRKWADDRLRVEAIALDGRGDVHRQLNASLALLPIDSQQTDFLNDRLLEATPDELPVICEVLRAHSEVDSDRLWEILKDETQSDGHRFRAACALSLVLQDHANNLARWSPFANYVTDQFLQELSNNHQEHARLVATLLPIREVLWQPLAAAIRDEARSQLERSLAANVLVVHAADQPDVLAEAVMTADDHEFRLLLPALEPHRDVATRRFENEVRIDTAGGEHAPVAAHRIANAAIALALMGHADYRWSLLRQSPDPTARTMLIHRLRPLKVDLKIIVDRFLIEQDPAIQRSLIMILDEYSFEMRAASGRAEVVEKLLTLYGSNDAATHNVAEWLLKKWDEGERLQSFYETLATEEVPEDRNWFVNGQGQTMVVIKGPVTFKMGSPTETSSTGEVGTLRDATIPRTFAIASTEVTNAQFERLIERKAIYRNSNQPDHPCGGVNWFGAARYCNRLSEMEGIPEDQWCFIPDKFGEYQAGMALAPDYLHRTGYRMPTEAEWEHACRALTTTPYFFGGSEAFASKYEWTEANSAFEGRHKPHAVGTLKPNDIGLFDMLGSMREWCVGPLRGIFPYDASSPREFLDAENAQYRVNAVELRVLRGGSYYGSLWDCADWMGYPPSFTPGFFGLRVARTLDASSDTSLAARTEKLKIERAIAIKVLHRGGNVKLSDGPVRDIQREEELPEPIQYPVQNVSLWGVQDLSPQDIAELSKLGSLQGLDLGRTPLDNSATAQIGGINSLKWLTLNHTLIDDEGLPHLQDLNSLVTLNLSSTAITDDGLATLLATPGRFPKLERLRLAATAVTDKSLEVIGQRFAPLAELQLGDTKVSDAGLVHLKTLVYLERLELRNTNISDEGLVHLSHLKMLKNLELTGSQVTQAGIDALERELPNCVIQFSNAPK